MSISGESSDDDDRDEWSCHDMFDAITEMMTVIDLGPLFSPPFDTI